MSQFGVTVGNIAEDIIKVKADQEYAKGKIEGYKALQQVESEASQDDDFQTFEPKYSKRIKDTQEAISKTIRNPQAKQAFNDDFALKSTYSFHDIMADGRKRFLAYDKDLMAQEIVTTKERYFSASTTQEKQNVKDELAQIYTRRIGNKLLNKAEAGNLYKKELAGLDEGQAEHDILGNPQYALDQLVRKEKGIYPTLSELKRMQFIEDAQQKIDKQIAETSRQQLITYAENEDTLTDKKINGILSSEEVLFARNQNLIRSKFADTLIRSLKSAKAVNAQTDIKIFEDIFGNIINRDISATEIREKIFTANAQGKISNSDVKRLLFAEKGEGITTVYEDFIAEQEQPKSKNKPKRNFWGIANDVIKSSIPVTSAFYVTANVIDRIRKENLQGEQIIEVAKDEVRKQILIDKPEIVRLPKTGYLHRDKFGNTAIVYPDGTYEEVMKSTGEFKHKEQRKRKESEEK